MQNMGLLRIVIVHGRVSKSEVIFSATTEQVCGNLAAGSLRFLDLAMYDVDAQQLQVMQYVAAQSLGTAWLFMTVFGPFSA